MNNFFNGIDHQSIMPRRERPLVDLPPAVELARLRKAVMTQKEMAERVGVDRGQLSRFEHGKGEMSYDKIRRYVHVLNLRRTASDPRKFLIERIIHRGRIPELRPTDSVDHALETMVVHGIHALPVLTSRGDDYLGVLSDVAVCEALVDPDADRALARPVATLRLDPLDRVRVGDHLPRVAALLASQSLVLVEDDDGLPAGFATRPDLFPLVLGQGGR